ncbi:receptor-type tyrosine-protein phosphatase F-like isoform X2 [Dendronephthya gigantea]|uniref:receptor-type tyrosine-protein phosphatase F-like isoform X2 n=1 Tax=Dendronephthya gigantea TaxID=151771 RepID=UPI00106C1758|nr:receptor-type tyrosine-protein phosphatase F-like isoform X2 [Dendronephthya gigantea]
MFLKCFEYKFIELIVSLLYLHGVACFFVKHVKTRKCIYDTEQIHDQGPLWGSLSFLELSNNCLDPAAQFRFRSDNGAMLNLKRKGCLAIYDKRGIDEMFFVYVPATPGAIKVSACADHRVIKQTSWGGLRGKFNSAARCADPDGYMETNKSCVDGENKRFNFGSVTCYGETTENVACPKDQFMVVKNASYRGLSYSKTCGLSDDYSCTVDVTCLVKKQCDGQHECKITVDETLFSDDLCPGLKKYLYFEYQCIDTSKQYSLCVDNVYLSYSSLPNEGFLQIDAKYNGTKTVCWQSLKNNAKDVVCRQLGYTRASSVVNKTAMSSMKEVFSGNIDCDGKEHHLSQCSFTTSQKSCSQLSYIKCHICNNPLLEDKERFPDSSFTASVSSEGHRASDARISSGSSWCAPVSDDKHYLQVDLGRLYVFYAIATFGDSTGSKWVTSFNLNHTIDLVNWRRVQDGTLFQGNKNAYNDAAITSLNVITTRALRFIPLSNEGQPCMRVEICGDTLYPDQLRNLIVFNIKSRSVEISWIDPENQGFTNVSRFWIKMKKNDSLILNITTEKLNEYKMNKLTPDTSYEISVAAGNNDGFGEEKSIMFSTREDAPEGPPLNVTVTTKNSSSLSVTWNPPEEEKRNGVIVNYTVCISHEETKPCFKEHTTEKMMLVIDSLNASTKYYVRVLASTKVGRGNYSKSQGIFTNGERTEMATNKTITTLTFPLQSPSDNFTYFYVVALRIEDNDKLSSPSNYDNNDLVTYEKAKTSAKPKPYIAAVITSRDKTDMFILGDGGNTSFQTTRRRRSTTIDYYNGPLESGASYSIFQRIFLNDKDEFYSTDWSPASTTVGKMTTSATNTPRTIRTDSSTTTKSDDNNEESDNIPIIAGAAGGGCLLLILVIVVIILCRRRRKDKKDHYDEVDYKLEEKPRFASPAINEGYLDPNDGDLGPKGSIEVQQNPTVAGADEVDVSPVQEEKTYPSDFAAGDKSIYGNQEAVVARIHNPVPVDEFSDHVNNRRQNDKKDFKLEFEDLPTAHISKGDISKRAFNRQKNRYGNAVTYNDSRVILSGDEKSDYINASYINGLVEKSYIATQGPKPATVNDFWRMIFEHKCPTIVMLTTLKEMAKVKCEKYWPDDSGLYGDIKVTARKTRIFADYVTRIFTVEKGGEQHGVQQFHFKAWPDFGVPHYPTQILTFRGHFKSFHETKAGSAVIHCSAGVGRTGVFIAVDKILDDLDKEKKDVIDIFGFVKDMRTRRMNMVQTADQYVFIHDAIVDHIKCGANEVQATHVKFEIKKLSEQTNEGQTGFEEKFKRLNTVSPKLMEDQCEAGLLEENKKKNRKEHIYPSESGRACLSHIENVANSDYINACFVDGYLGKNYFIATQTPLKETINDFWRMVTKYCSSTIVMLNQLGEDEEYPMFWPTQRAKPQSFGTTTVMLDSFVKKENIVVRKFIVSPSADLKNGHMLRLVQYMTWPDHGVPKNVNDLVKLSSEVEDAKRAAEKKGPIIVVCSDGAGRSGTYIAISNLVDRVKVVQVMDVFQCIKLIRAKRPQFVETAAQFKLCYEAVSAVLNSFNEYSNFSDTQTQ